MGWVLKLCLAVAVYELLRFLFVRRVRRRMHQAAVRFVREHRIKLESARFIDRVWVREALAQDAQIQEAIVAAAKETGTPQILLRDKVDEYVNEIAPFFSLSAYYRFGASVGRRVVDFCFEVVMDPAAFKRQAAKAPEGAVRVYVINHRANMDPLILAYSLLRHVPMSYAVGEWALVWPLDWLFRAFGSYFVRRGEPDPLYHKVLERFIQIIAAKGAVTGFFPEGGLSRDGALRKPRIGLLDYLVKLRIENPDRDIVFMPVGLNYDRVLEDRILTRERNGPVPKPTASERAFNLLGLLFWIPLLIGANMVKVATKSHRKFGYAAICFGEPLLLSDWEGGPELHSLPDEPRRVKMAELADELLNRRIAPVIPVLPVPVLCMALQAEGSRDEATLTRKVMAVLADLRAMGAPIRFGRAFARFGDAPDEAIPGADEEIRAHEEAEQVYGLASFALVRRRVLRRVHTPRGKGVEPKEGMEHIVAYYANSIRHHLDVVDAG
jgi:glycerol-3-phosphate O-acyltransferase